MSNTATIKIWNKEVGAIAWNPNTAIASFEFEESFLESNLNLAPLKMPLSQARNRIFEFPENRDSKAFQGLPGLIADVLPDKYGNALIDSWLLLNGKTSGSLNPVEKLLFIGKRGMGALEFYPPELRVTDTATKLEISSLINIVNDILNNRLDFQTNLQADEHKAMLDILKIGTSAGGARAKAVIAFNEKTGEVRSGQTNAPKGFTHWLIKFDGVEDKEFGESKGYGRIEMAYHLMAKDSGIEMTECRLLEENNRAHFMTKRFDRVGNSDKMHVQSFCAMEHYDFNDVISYSYEHLFQTMRKLGLPYPDAEQLYRRMVFNVLARNCDDHTKNFAFIMDKQGEWRLSPAYDVSYAFRPDSIWVSQQALSINMKRKKINTDDLMQVAKQMNIKKAKQIIEQIENSVQNWSVYAKKTNVMPDHIIAIEKEIKTSQKN